MFDDYLLRQLVTFAECGTLSETAQKLHLSQPALSRSMKKIEEFIGVELFVRTKNSIALNDNGKLAAEYARQILNQHRQALEKIREFDRKNRTITVGCCAPVPMNKIIYLLTQIFTGVTVSSELNADEYLLSGLRNDIFDLIVLHQPPDDNELFASECGKEKLYLSIPLKHKFAEADGVYLSELNGEKVLLYSKIGFWYDLCKRKAPNAKFLMQSDREVFKNLTAAEAFLNFTTDVLIESGYSPTHSVIKPVLDAEASVTYYCTCKLNRKAQFRDLFDGLRTTTAKFVWHF